MLTHLHTLHIALGAWETLDKFVLKGGLAEALQVLGEVEVTAARKALKSSANASHPGDEVRNAIVHLQSAQAAYRRQWYVSPFGAVLDFEAYAEGTQNYVFVTFLLASCYAWLGERKLVLEELRLAEECRKARISTRQVIQRGGPTAVLGWWAWAPFIPKNLIWIGRRMAYATFGVGTAPESPFELYWKIRRALLNAKPASTHPIVPELHKNTAAP
jgi:hypothetical protein